MDDPNIESPQNAPTESWSGATGTSNGGRSTSGEAIGDTIAAHLTSLMEGKPRFNLFLPQCTLACKRDVFEKIVEVKVVVKWLWSRRSCSALRDVAKHLF